MTAIVKSGLEPQNLSEAKSMAVDAAKSRFFAGLQTPEAAFIVILSGKDLGLSAAQSLRAFHVVEGRPALSADGMVAVCLNRQDICEYFRTVESTAERCTVETKRRGSEPVRLTFTLEDAQRADLVGRKMWQKFPANMLRARAKSALARDVYPDLLLGLYDPDELVGETARVEYTTAPTAVVATEQDPWGLAPAPPESRPPDPQKQASPQPDACPECGLETDPAGKCRSCGWRPVVQESKQQVSVTRCKSHVYTDEVCVRCGALAGEKLAAVFVAKIEDASDDELMRLAKKLTEARQALGTILYKRVKNYIESALHDRNHLQDITHDQAPEQT